MKRAIESSRISIVLPFVTLLLLAFSAAVFAGEPAGSLMAARKGGGYWLAQTRDLSVWWCESGWKVGRDTGLLTEPSGNTKPVSVSMARGEFEAAQVVLRAEKQGQLLLATVGSFRSPSWREAFISVEISEVAYVQVTHPTESTGVKGWYPDPLPPLLMPLSLPAGQNQPLWLTFHVPRGTRSGDYNSELRLKTTLGDIKVPLHVHVYDFSLPEETHLKSALGMGSHAINQYHHLEQQQDKEAVYEKYLRNFAAHRISPYSFYDYAPIDVQFKGEVSNKQAQVDFTKFDQAAEQWLDRAHFNTFMLPLRGMGGGTFQSRHLGELEGFQEGTPEFARLFQDYLGQVEAHLLARKWLPKAFTYWFDEPAPKDFEFVVEGMKRLHAAAPGIRRMLTIQPEPPLIGNVDIWCGLTPKWTPELVRQRQEAGEEVWWYICCSPHAPYITEFIDHPGTELRLWPWQSWQNGVQGILIWETLYWTSPAAFPPPKLQDPWADPMSYVSGYDQKPGEVGYWGNGDGRFLYPPRRDASTEQSPCLDAPINSMRWENLRDGMEDYEYFWLLKQAASRELAWHGDTVLLRQAEELLKVPPAVSADLTHFTTDPRLMLYHRDRVACMIEILRSSP